MSMRTPSPAPMSSITSRGVAKTPTRELADAATIAPETLPRAMEVNATEDCTVEGTNVSRRMPA